jgi:hypothetical protein
MLLQVSIICSSIQQNGISCQEHLLLAGIAPVPPPLKGTRMRIPMAQAQGLSGAEFGKDQLSTGEVKKSEIIFHFLFPAH